MPVARKPAGSTESDQPEVHPDVEKAQAQAAADAEATEEQSAEDRQAQSMAATRAGGVRGPGRAALTEEQQEELEERQQAAVEVTNTLQDLDRASLVALQGAVENALRGKGEEPEQAGPTVLELASALPINEDETGDTEISDAVGALPDESGVEEEHVVAVAVRQARGIGGKAVGPKYVVVVTDQGQKHAAKL